MGTRRGATDEDQRIGGLENGPVESFEGAMILRLSVKDR